MEKTLELIKHDTNGKLRLEFVFDIWSWILKYRDFPYKVSLVYRMQN